MLTLRTYWRRRSRRVNRADGEYLAWLTLTVMDGMLVQSQLKNPALDTDAFIEATARLITEC